MDDVGGAVADDSTTIELSRSELREVAAYAVACARPALAIFERERPDDRRPRAANDTAQAFADGGERTKAMRDSAWAAHRAAQETRDAGQAAASDAARAAANAAGAAFLHPWRKPLRSSTSSDRPLMPHEHSNSPPETIPPSEPTRSFAVAGPCASRRGGRPEALPGRPTRRWAGRIEKRPGPESWLFVRGRAEGIRNPDPLTARHSREVPTLALWRSPAGESVRQSPALSLLLHGCCHSPYCGPRCDQERSMNTGRCTSARGWSSRAPSGVAGAARGTLRVIRTVIELAGHTSFKPYPKSTAGRRSRAGW